MVPWGRGFGARLLDEDLVKIQADAVAAHQALGDRCRWRLEGEISHLGISRPQDPVDGELIGTVQVLADCLTHSIDPILVEETSQANCAVCFVALDICFSNSFKSRFHFAFSSLGHRALLGEWVVAVFEGSREDGANYSPLVVFHNLEYVVVLNREMIVIESEGASH